MSSPPSTGLPKASLALITNDEGFPASILAMKLTSSSEDDREVAPGVTSTSKGEECPLDASPISNPKAWTRSSYLSGALAVYTNRNTPAAMGCGSIFPLMRVDEDFETSSTVRSEPDDTGSPRADRAVTSITARWPVSADTRKLPPNAVATHRLGLIRSRSVRLRDTPPPVVDSTNTTALLINEANGPAVSGGSVTPGIVIQDRVSVLIIMIVSADAARLTMRSLLRTVTRWWRSQSGASPCSTIS
mmetsp:Transcript_55345/g.83764  ORF Transcript_55345/g.83764 Transcript_55345/m.83764 type:complete len:246 (+) Transcript_55345:1211-1948(+)